MAQASLSIETLREALDAVAEHGSISAAARALKIPIPTLITSLVLKFWPH